MADPDELPGIKARLDAARKKRRFYGPHSALKDLDWLIAEVDRLRELLDRAELTP